MFFYKQLFSNFCHFLHQTRPSSLSHLFHKEQSTLEFLDFLDLNDFHNFNDFHDFPCQLQFLLLNSHLHFQASRLCREHNFAPSPWDLWNCPPKELFCFVNIHNLKSKGGAVFQICLILIFQNWMVVAVALATLLKSQRKWDHIWFRIY